MEDYVEEALALVEAWDLPTGDEFADGVNAQARLMAGSPVDPADSFTEIAIKAHLHR